MDDIMFLITTLGFLVLYIVIIVRNVKEIRTIKMKRDDREIKAVVIKLLPSFIGDVRPVLQYYVDGVEKHYSYHFPHFVEENPIGKEMALQLSEKSGLAYDRRDIMKELWTYVILLIIFVFGLLMLFFNVINAIGL